VGGSAISPLLANLFMHYAFDAWMSRTYPGVTFERYCDDVVVHCSSQAQAEQVQAAIGARLAEVALELHPVKTRIVYCKDANRRLSAEFEQFTFLGYTFRPRLAKTRVGDFFVSFAPAVSREAVVRIGRTIRSWRIHRRSDLTFPEIVAHINLRVTGREQIQRGDVVLWWRVRRRPVPVCGVGGQERLRLHYLQDRRYAALSSR